MHIDQSVTLCWSAPQAYVIFNFFMYMMTWLEDQYGDVDIYFSTKPPVRGLWAVFVACSCWT